MRAGFESVSYGTIEAGAALGMSKFQIFVYVTFWPALRNAFPALINQFILLFLFSSVTATISMPELTYVTMNLQISNFLFSLNYWISWVFQI
jgi:polar amino acid transport system permease protein